MTISDTTVAIIGTGNIGGRLAAGFAAGGQDFLLAGRDADAARKLAADLGGHAEVVSPRMISTSSSTSPVSRPLRPALSRPSEGAAGWFGSA